MKTLPFSDSILQAARHPKSFVSLDKADHLLTKSEDSLYVGSVIAAWSQKYIPAARKDEREQSLTDNRVGARIGKTGFLSEIIANDHSLVTDEPVAVSGTNMGPTPYDYLVVGLGACTSMTLRMYADRKKRSLDSVTVTLKHRKIHAEDCQACETEKGMQALEKSGHIKKGAYHLYLHNRLTLVVPEGNPAGIASVSDMAKDHVRISHPDPTYEDIVFHIMDMYRQVGGNRLVYRSHFK